MHVRYPRNFYNILVRKAEWKKTSWQMYEWMGVIKFNLTEIECEGMD